MPQLDRPGGVRAGRGDKYPQIARFNVLRTGVSQYVQHIGLGGNVAVLGGSPGEVRQRKILLWEYSSPLSGIRIPVAQDPWA